MTVKAQPVILTTELPGRTSACLVAEVRPQVSGIIKKRLFAEGSHVKAGELLYQIDAAPFQAAYDSASASLNRAEATLPAIRSRVERYRESLASKAVSQQDFDDVESAFRQAEAEVKYWKATVQSASINLGYTRVTAPISGRIGKSNVTAGALVTANQPTPLTVIQQFDPIYVDVPQSTTELLRLKRRMEGGLLSQNDAAQKKVQLLMEDGTTYPNEGILQFRDITVDPTTGTVNLRAVFPNPEDILLPGMFVRAVVQEGVNNKAILVPQQAVSRDPKGTPLTLIVDSTGKVEQRQLTIDRAVGDQWLITSGLAAGDRVVIEGVQKVKPGMPVKAIAARADGNTAPSAPPAK
ncbi:MAG: efflux RND transporter periplasmic adaptor subunit [Syntrophaceae bacterium]